MTSAIFSQADLHALSAPHVSRAWFLEMDLPSGVHRLHSGSGRYELEGHEWRGVSDPVGGMLAQIGDIEEARHGQAPAIKVGLSGANAEFLRSVHATAAEIEGRAATLYFVVMDPETARVLVPLTALVRGRLTAPGISWESSGQRLVTVTIESRWSGQNYPFVGKWNHAGQLKRYPGDLGMQYVGQKTVEKYE